MRILKLVCFVFAKNYMDLLSNIGGSLLFCWFFLSKKLYNCKICGRPMRVDHVENYGLPQHIQEKEENAKKYVGPGHAYIGRELSNEYSLEQGQDLFAPIPHKKEEEHSQPTKSINDGNTSNNSDMSSEDDLSSVGSDLEAIKRKTMSKREQDVDMYVVF